MSKIISLPFCLLFLLWLAISMAEMVVGEVDKCREGLGICYSVEDCDSKCKARHKPEENPQGSCDYSIYVPTCYCNSCGGAGATPKMCYAGLGLCYSLCDGDCCKAKCASLHHGGQGYCADNAGYNMCQCRYPC